MSKIWDKPHKNPLVIFWFVILAVVLAVNFFMISTAIMTNPGLVSENYYDKGKNYDQVLADRAHMQSLGWKTQLNIPSIYTEKMFSVAIAPIDAQGRLLTLENATLYFYRPLEKRQDLVYPMTKVGDQWQTQAKLPLKGNWDVLVEYFAEGERYIETAKVLVVNQPQP